MFLSHSRGRWCCQRRRHWWRIRKLLWIWPGRWLWLWLWKWLWVWCFRQQDHLFHHHSDQEIPPIEEMRSLQPPEPSWAQSWCLCASFTSASTLPFWDSSHQCHLSAGVWTLPFWSLVVSSQCGLGDLPGMRRLSADSSPHMERGEHNHTLHLQNNWDHMCAIPAWCYLLPDPRYLSTSGPTPSPSLGSNWPCKVRTRTTQCPIQPFSFLLSIYG